MPKLSKDAEFALHEFSVRYRAARAKDYTVSDQFMAGIKAVVREQYEKERQGSRGWGIEAPKIEAPKIESPSIEEPKIEGSKIEPPKNQQREMEGQEPEI